MALETWTLTKVVSIKIDSFDLWCHRRIVCVHYSHNISNSEKRNRTGCTTSYRHHPSQTAATLRPRCKVWTWNGSPSRSTSQFEDRLLTGNDRGRPRHTWTRTVENDLKPANIVLHTAWQQAQDRADWRNFVTTAALHCRGMLYWRWWWD